MSGAYSGGISGTPTSLPPNWILVAGYLIGPGANLTQADLAGADLTGANLYGANLYGAQLVGTDLIGAILTGVSWNDTECPDGTNSNNDGDTCVNNLF